MAKAKSRFNTVLRVKQHQEKVTQQQLQQIQDVHHKEEEVLRRLREAREEAVEETRIVDRARASDLQTQRAFIFKLTRQIDHQTSKVDDIRDKEEAKREELTARARSRQMVEKIDEKRKAEQARELDRKEQAVMDEVANRIGKTV